MDTNSLKKFAQEARIKLMTQIEAKLEFVLNTDSKILRDKKEALKKLNQEINTSSKAIVIEKVAYTWFNRLVALRFMDANNYQPIGVQVLTPKQGFTLPEILDEAKQGDIADELRVNKKYIYDILDGKIDSDNAQNEAYKELLIGACNHLNVVFPFLFEKISDYTELLLPDDLISEFSIVQDIRLGMTDEECENVEIIGWIYQFYISERKDEVFASKSKVEKEDIPAATQLFTPRWIVEYMVQNTVGKLWLQNNPKSKIREHMPYFIESASVENDDYLKINSVEEIKLLDPACGSGHILVYAFELLSKIYEEEGYNPSEIAKLIVDKNILGFEIDQRASQLAGFALLMKARSYHRRVFKKELKPKIICFKDIVFSDEDLSEVLALIDMSKSEEIIKDIKLIENATNFGSLIIPETSTEILELALENVKKQLLKADMFQQEYLYKLKFVLKQLIPLSRKYHCIAANPPYMGGGNMNKTLAGFVKKNYPDSKADLMACFMESGLKMLLSKGFLGMINQHSWMFLSSYEKLREKLINTSFIDTLLHLGPRTFPEIGGEVVQNTAFTFWNTTKQEKGKYIRLVDQKNSDLKRTKTLEAIQNNDCSWLYSADQKDFLKIPGSPIGYWVSEGILKLFHSNKTIQSVANTKSGMSTTDNEQFLRRWHEVFFNKADLNSPNKIVAKEYNKKWYPYNKGGLCRKWYGNREFFVNWQNDGKDIRDCIAGDPKKQVGGRIVNECYYFSQGIGWSDLTSGKVSARLHDEGSLFDSVNPVAFLKNKEDEYFLLGLLNTSFINTLSKLINPTLHFTPGNARVLPIPNLKPEQIKIVVEIALKNSKQEWNSRETSWDFLQNELIKHQAQDLEESYDLYKQYWHNKFFQLHTNEEELNKQFIDIYGLTEELTPDVRLEDITILKTETKIIDNELVFQAKEIFAQFMSYAVGCMFGRYSLDKEGLILANQGENLEDYLVKVNAKDSASTPLSDHASNQISEHTSNQISEPDLSFSSLNDLSFVPDDDNIIPVLNDEWFEDDIVNRFYVFLKASFGKENFEKNLAFVEESLGKDIRKYFIKDFYADHIKRYNKRPIYWMFSSPKGNFNVLIYMHRYTPDTLNQILNGYLREYKEKLNIRIEQLDNIINTADSTDSARASKEKDKLRLVIKDLLDYERDILYPLATERIAIDLDDGVLVNYNKFGDAIKTVSSLNDKKAKAKVRKFDWIDVETII